MFTFAQFNTHKDLVFAWASLDECHHIELMSCKRKNYDFSLRVLKNICVWLMVFKMYSLIIKVLIIDTFGSRVFQIYIFSFQTFKDIFRKSQIILEKIDKILIYM